MNTPDNKKADELPPEFEAALQTGKADEMQRLGQRVAKPPVKPKYALQGPPLFDESVLRPMSLEDVDEGVAAIYQDAEIDPAYLLAMKYGRSSELDEYLKRNGVQRGGMLHRWCMQPRSAMKGDSSTLLSVRDEMLEALNESGAPETIAESIRIVNECRHDIAKVFQATQKRGEPFTLFKGAILSPVLNSDVVLAYGTWEEPNDPKDYKRRVVNQFEQMNLDAGMNISETDYIENAGKTVMFDTICGAQPGGAHVMFERLVPYWMQQGNRRILLYRHKLLRVLCEADIKKDEGPKMGIPTGNNDTSEGFFRKRGLTEIGTELSNAYAPFGKEDDDATYYARSTFGWMMGELSEVRNECAAITRERVKRFDSGAS